MYEDKRVPDCKSWLKTLTSTMRQTVGELFGPVVHVNVVAEDTFGLSQRIPNVKDRLPLTDEVAAALSVKDV